MKRCPTCHSTYTDESLSFCLKDGALLADDLLPAPTTQETLIYQNRPAHGQQAAVPQEALKSGKAIAPKRRTLPLVIAVIATIGVAALTLIYFSNRGASESTVRSSTANSMPSPQPAITTATPEMKESASVSPSPESVSEASAEPTPAESSPTPTPGASPAAAEVGGKLRLESQFFVFDLKQCRMSGSTVICELVITNTDADRVLRLGDSTKMFDDSGSEYSAKQVQVANKEGDSVEPTLINGVATKARFTFEGVSPQATRISLLDIYGIPRVRDAQDFHIQFRNIPLKK